MFFEFVSKRIRFDWVDWVEKEKNMVSLVSRTGRCLQRYDMKGYRQVVGCVILAVIFVEYVATFFFPWNLHLRKFSHLGICQMD